MPTEHELLYGLLFRVMYFARNKIDYGTEAEKMQHVRDAVAKMLREQDNNRVGLRVLDACQRVLYLIDNRGLDQPYTRQKIAEACEFALARPRLGQVTDQTWNEQIAGRTRLLELQQGDLF